MNSLQISQTMRNRRNNAQKVQRSAFNYKTTKVKAINRRKKDSNSQNHEENEGIDHGMNEDDDRNLHNIDNDVISDDAEDDASSDSQESNRSVEYRSDDSDDEHCSFESKLQLDGFDIYDEINYHFLKFTMRTNEWINRSEYENQKLSERHPFTVQEFSEEFSAILAKQIVQKGTDTEILSLLKRFVPDVNWPVKIGKNNSCSSNMDTFKEPELPFLKFHICPLFCTAFVGTLKQCRTCPHCQSPRFTNRSDNLDSGTPLATISYRPLTFLFMDLLKMKGFLPLFLHEYHKPSFNSKYEYMDVSDGIAYKRTLKEMEENFKRHYPVDTENNPIMVNFVLSQFLDGVQIWKKKVAHFAPYLINILNLPPTYRGKLGLGMFLISLITCKANSGAEKFILEHCLLQELKRFEVGQMIEIDNQQYFVQARLKLTILDTAGLKGFLHLANPQNSYWGCWSCRFHSIPGEQTGSVYFGGHRSYLPLEHYLRCLGKTEQCCPIGYFLTDENIIKNNFKTKNGTGTFREAFINVKPDNSTNDGRVNVKLLQSCCAEVQGNIRELKRFLGDNKAIYTTHHPSFNGILDSAHLIHYHNCDYRKQKQLELLGNQEFKKFTETYPTYYKEPFHMTSLSYFKFQEDIPYGPFHCCKNTAYNILACMKGERAKNTQQIIAYSEYTQTHLPHFARANDDVTPPWLYSNDQQCKIDAYINCIVIPSSLSNEFAFNNIFQQTGFLRCADLIKFVKIVLKLIPFIAPKQGYDTFYEMISEDFCDLFAPYFSEEDLKNLQDRLFETVALHEGQIHISSISSFSR